uniref:F-box domain-containing protein n=1 Tax=Kalanchoe fedtschenkoi TaxID=63787 RepID=A0A7N0UFZ8_KALFE
MRQPHEIASSADVNSKQSSKRRGNYNCGRCGQPKKGHVCNVAATTPAPPETVDALSVMSSTNKPYTNLRRALSFEDLRDSFPESDEDEEGVEVEDEGVVAGGLPVSCMWEVMRRLPPVDLMTSAKVCTSWRDLTRRVWRSVEELRLRVPSTAMVGFVGSVLKKCPMLTRLALRMESDVDATTLACIAFSCPNLESMEIAVSQSAVNRITGDELSRFVGDKRCLTSLKVEGCSSLGSIIVSSSSLTTLWLSDLYCLSKMAFNCPNLQEVSLDFSRQGNDNTDLTAMVDGLGRGCPMLQNIHIASERLTHKAVLSLTAANLRELRMLSLVLGSGITDASVAAIASCYPELELLDLSGSSISDSGIGMICGVFSETLSRLLLALCPNVTSSGIQFATAQLPLLELMDCGMTVSYPDPQPPTPDEDLELPVGSNKKPHFTCQKLIVKHDRLKKFSLWGCSALDALNLNCPKLNDLNLNSCRNLQPERLLLQCPNLETVHASGCSDKLISGIKKQVSNHPTEAENYSPSRRMPDGSKRVRVPLFLHQPPGHSDKREKRPKKRQCTVHVG